MTSRRVLALCFILIAGIFVLGCNTRPSGSGGSLVVRLGADGVAARTIVPPVSMEVYAYDITGAGPGTASFAGAGLTGDSHQWDELIPGQWTVTVDARNADGTVIARATGTAAIAAGETTELALTVVPLAGPGTLSVSLSWPASAVSVPAVSASLVPESGSPVALELAVSGNAASWSSTEVDAGYYTLILQLRNEGDPVWGRAEAVRVLAGQTVAASYPLTDADINASSTGGLVLRIQAALMSPFEITLGGLQPSLPLQSEMTVTAHADPAPDSWQWYLNGNPVTGEAREAITVGAALAPGHYWLDVVARRGGVLSSAHAFFTVSSQLAAAAPSVGEAVINEIMIDPAGVADTSGEWFEITNAAGKPLDIEGLVLRTASQFVRIAASGTGVILAPGAFFVFCRNGDPAGNGGVGADYVWTGISLPNSGGSLAIAGFGTNGMDGTVIDAVQWTSAVAGKALALRTANRNAVDNDVAANWYWSSTPYSASDMGTPGATNEQ